MTDGAAAAAESVSDFFRQVGMPTRLRDVGVPAGGITAIAEDALTDFGLHRNVRPVQSAAELASLLESAW